jgi:hypothetical protein
MKTLGTILMVIVGFMFDSKMDTSAVDSLSQRTTVATINNAKGIVYKVGDDDTYMIECAEKHLKLHAFNLPAAYKKDNIAIQFSGDIKFTNTLEDDCGELFKVTAIQ